MKQYLDDAIKDYLLFRQSQDYSKGTLKNDRMALTKFLATVGNIGVHNIESRHITRHMEQAAKTCGAATLSNHHQILSTFFEWARHTRRMPLDSDPMFGRRVPRGRKRERHRIHVSKFGHLLDLAEERDPRDRALIAVMLYTLLRDSEVATLRLSDVDLDAGYITAIIHKSRKEDRVPISLELDQELRKWMTYYATQVGDLNPAYYLIPRRRSWMIRRSPTDGTIVGHEFHYEPLNQIGPTAETIKPLLAKVGVVLEDGDGKPTFEGAHTLRRSGARALFDHLVSIGYDQALRVVQAMLHHESQSTTEGYIGITADKRTRDELIRGQLMYADMAENVVALRQTGTDE